MNRFRVHAMPVLNADGTVFGIITATDCSQLRLSKKNPKAVKAWELCTYKPLVVGADTPAAQVARMMLKKRIHHVLVTEDGALRGIVSTFDFVQQYVNMRRD